MIDILIVISIIVSQNNQLVNPEPISHFNNITSYNAYLIKIEEEYNKANLVNYEFSKLDNNMIFINPCIGNNWFYCEQNNFNFEENYKIIANNDLFIIFETYRKIYECNEFFQIKTKCGSYFEIHKPLNENAWYTYELSSKLEVKIPTTNPSPTSNKYRNQIFLKIDNLCAGVYHLWYVIDTINKKKQIVSIKPFFIIYPNCQSTTQTN